MKKKRVGLTLIVVLVVTSFLLVMDVILGVVMVSTSNQSTKSILDNKMLELAQTAAKLVDGDEIASLTPEDKDDPSCVAYTHNYDILSKFKTSNEEHGADLAYIYCLVKYNDQIVFSIDPDLENPAEFMMEAPDPVTDGMVKAFNGETCLDSSPVEDEWGLTYSAYAPIYKSDKTTIAGVIGVDVWASWYQEQMKQSIITISIISSLSIAGGVGIALLITFFMRRRLTSISNEVSSLEDDVQTLLKEIRSSKYEEIKEDKDNRADMEHIRSQIQTASQEIRKYIAYSRKRAFTDSLTKLNNRQAYFERVKGINLKIKEGQLTLLSVIVYDVNGLKDINDTYGHEFGDIALIKAANILRDIYSKDNTYRIGGDEIVVILEDISLDEIKEKEKLFDDELKTVNAMSTDLPVKLSLSNGLASFNAKTDNEFLDVFRKADKNMYENKDEFYKTSGARHR